MDACVRVDVAATPQQLLTLVLPAVPDMHHKLLLGCVSQRERGGGKPGKGRHSRRRLESGGRSTT